MAINAQQLQGQWNQLKGQVREKWGQLTDDDLQLTGGNVDQRQNHRTAVEIMARATRYPATGIVKQLRIELRGFVQVANL